MKTVSDLPSFLSNGEIKDFLNRWLVHLIATDNPDITIRTRDDVGGPDWLRSGDTVYVNTAGGPEVADRLERLAKTLRDRDRGQECTGCGHDFDPDTSPNLTLCWQCDEAEEQER